MRMPYALISTIYLFFVVILFLVPARTLSDADTGWHIMAGHQITEEGQVPYNDTFSYTAGDYEWLNLSWLWDVYVSWLDSIGGLYLVAGMTILLGGITIALSTWFCLNRGAGVVASMFAVTFGMLGFMPGLLARPHQVTNLFSVLFLIILYFFAKKPDNYKTLFFLAPIMLLWANMHGGFMTGFIIMGAYFLQFLFCRQFREAKLIVIFGFITLAAVFINPMGIDIFEATYRTLGGPMKVYIHEWHAPQEPRDFIYIALFTIVFVLSFRTHSISEKLLCIFFLIQALMAIRILPLFAIISIPTLSNGIVYLGGRYQRYRDKEHEYETQFSNKFLNKFLPLVAIYLTMAMLTPQWGKIIGFKPNSANYPKEEIDYIIKHRPNAVLLNNYDFGGYVIYESKGKLKTFIDGRAETAFPPPILNDYIAFDARTDGWQKMIEKHNIDTILMPEIYSEQLKYFENNSQWQKAFTGKQAVVYFKK